LLVQCVTSNGNGKLAGVALLVEVFFTGQRPALELLVLSMQMRPLVCAVHIDLNLERTIMANSENKQGQGGGRGFAGMDESKQREIASEGGRAAHESGHAHEFTSEEAREAGRKGGEAVSEDREHMSEIGQKGGESVSHDRKHMSEIGQKGGEHSHGGSNASGGNRGGSSEQHAEAGRQSHKNT
jgi:general stress protein YciG